MTSDELGFLTAVCAQPADDHVRLVYADWLEEHGGRPQRAEFIRVQVEVARVEKWPGWTPTMDEITAYGKKLGGIEQLRAVWRVNNHNRESKLDELRRRSRALIEAHGFSLCDGHLGGVWKTLGAEKRSHDVIVRYKNRESNDYTDDFRCRFVRGFLTELTSTAADFVRHADALCWHPTQFEGRSPTYEERQEYACDVCGNVPDEGGVIEHGRGCYTQGEDGGGSSWVESWVELLAGARRPCPPTAQPITKVTLTTFPEAEIGSHSAPDIVLTGDPKRERIPARVVGAIHPPDIFFHPLLRYRFGSHVEYVLPVVHMPGQLPDYHTISRIVGAPPFDLTADQVAQLTPDQVEALLRQIVPVQPL